MSDDVPDETLFEELVSKLLDGELHDSEREQLRALLRHDADRVDELRSHLMIADLLQRDGDPARSEDAFLAATSWRLEHVGQDEAFTEKIGRKIRFPRLLGSLIAAGGLAAAFAWTFFAQKIDVPEIEEYARVGLIDPSVAEQIGGIAEGERVEGGSYAFQEGVLRLDFPNGAVVTIEGPARFELVSGDLMRLSSGKLNAWCPETAHGFRVETPQAVFTDLGTSFGVIAGEGDADRLTVFDGEVAVQSDDDSVATTILTGRRSLMVSSQAAIEEVAFDGSLFKNIWPITSGIIRTNGQIVPPPPDSSIHLMQYESNRELIVLPERRNFRIEEPIDVQITEPGWFRMGEVPTEPWQPKNPHRRVKSYLLHYNPVGDSRDMSFKRFRGSVTFDGRILAVIGASDSLYRSDQLAKGVAIPEGQDVRGVEANDEDAPQDRVYISKNRRTLKVDLYAGPSIDQLRIIVSEKSLDQKKVYLRSGEDSVP